MNNTLELSGTSMIDKEVLFTRLYIEAFPIVASFVSKNGSGLEEAKDVFHDALVIYYEKLRSGQFKIEISEKAYLLGIARHIYNRRYKGSTDVHPLNKDIETLKEEKEPTPVTARLLRFLEISGQKCMDLLKAYYYDKLHISKIATDFGYSGIRSATVQKYKCLQKLRNTIKAKSLSYEDFLD